MSTSGAKKKVLCSEPIISRVSTWALSLQEGGGVSVHTYEKYFNPRLPDAQLIAMYLICKFYQSYSVAIFQPIRRKCLVVLVGTKRPVTSGLMRTAVIYC